MTVNLNSTFWPFFKPRDLLTPKHTGSKKLFPNWLFRRVSQYLSVLQAQEVDFHTFLTLTEEDLKELGVTSFGAKKKLVTAIQG